MHELTTSDGDQARGVSAAMTKPDDAVLERGFYFIVVLWGERFRDYFLEYCLPSLLSPGNRSAT